MTIHYITKPTKPEPLSIETALLRAKTETERKLIQSIADAEVAKAKKHREWIAGCRQTIKAKRAAIVVTGSALRNAQADHDQNIEDMLNAYVCLVEALDGSNEFKNDFGHEVPKGGKTK